MQASNASIACMKSYQMTIRQVPEKVSRKLREVSRREAKSLNRTALEALERGLGIAEEPVLYHDLDDLSGTWVEDKDFNRVVAEMDHVDPELAALVAQPIGTGEPAAPLQPDGGGDLRASPLRARAPSACIAPALRSYSSR
jgi:hypothetical protein